MATKRLLIAAPLVLVAFLLQSWLWVPSYERQTRGNPDRVTKFFEGSIGDAHFLNPVLSDETTGSDVNALVYDTLLDLDENLALRGKLAERWEVTERAYVVVRPDAALPDGAPATAAALRDRIAVALGAAARSVAVEPAAVRTERREVLVPGEGGAPRGAEVEVKVRVPERIAIELGEVRSALAGELAPVLGDGYLAGFEPAAFVDLPEGAEGESLRAEVPDLLPALEHNPVLVFHLRPGVRFHDGHPLDAGDVKFTYEAFVDPKNVSPRMSDFEPVKTVEIADPLTVRVVYKRLFSPAVYVWSYYGILPEHLLGKAALTAEMDRRGIAGEARERFGLRDSEAARRPIGSGPFRFVEWRSDDAIQLRRNDAYWDGPAQYRDYTIRIVPDLLTQELEFRSGALDIFGVQPHQAARYREDPRYRAFSATTFGYSYVGYNARRKPFDDPDVRRALGMAIDVEQIIEFVLYGEGERVSGPFAITTEWYDRKIAPVAYDPEGALRLLESKGWKRGPDGILAKDGKRLEFSLITNNGNPQRKAIATIAQNAWRKIGVDCRVQLFEWAVFLKDFINTGEFDAVVLGWSTGIDPDMYQIWHSSQTDPQELNFTGYKNPVVDRLLEQVRLEYDRGRQVELAHELHRLIAADQPYTFLFASRGTTVVDRKIVMVTREPGGGEKIEPLRPAPNGQLTYWFTRWKKLDYTPDF
ncbi:MAG TPA: ABC transporter substrate-binding protein [Myxococcota bacterium]|nr:ABC transporter substrate-binding protein [Myxococcota bacterium]